MNIFKKQKNILNTDFFYILLIVLISLLLSAPLYTQGFYWSHDGVNYSTNSGIISKQIPPLIVSNFCKNYGYSWNIFYPPLGTYISGFFSLFTSILDAMKLTIMLSIALSGISMFKLMKKISKKQQVVCITHLAQVACFANNHLFIEKEQMDNTSKVHVRLLNEKESVYELAKMISGKEITQQSIDHAKKLKEICV